MRFKSAITIAWGCQLEDCRSGAFNEVFARPFYDWLPHPKPDESRVPQTAPVNCLINGVKIPSFPVNARPDWSALSALSNRRGLGHVSFAF
ncbi:hypothetical protein KCP75_10950 [Salmonella enterica subsp. enterica]|nr:hypothetical protein KCP75_10950 [Salmonella enterica subsp. enterica]